MPMPQLQRSLAPPAVEIIGDADHADFRDAISLLRESARIVNESQEPVELVVVAQSRPGMIGQQQIELLRQSKPLAGVVALLGSWCEGETRTGRPWPGVERLYWYEFPAWWQRQLDLRSAGRCPDWARPDAHRFSTAACHTGPGTTRFAARGRDLIALRASHHDTTSILADILHRAGYATVEQSFARKAAQTRGAAAGIWDGGQLSDHETNDLAQFCRRLAIEGAPVVALLDFPRRDRVDLALQLGAAAVLGKPWINVEVIGTLQAVIESKRRTLAA
jgi:hypothetical protein